MNWFCRYFWHRWMVDGFNRRRRICTRCLRRQWWGGAVGWQDDLDSAGYGWGV